MRLMKLCDVQPDDSGTIYRQGRLAGAVMVTIFSGLIIGAAVFFWFTGMHWLAWGITGLIAAFLVPLLVGDFRDRMRPTNWLVWLQPNCLWINVRSYQDRSSTDVLCVVRLEFGEIAEAREYLERYSVPTTKGSTRYKLRSLDLELKSDQTAELLAAISDNRKRLNPTNNYMGVKVTGRASHFPVHLVKPNLIRISWRGGQSFWATPSLDNLLENLSQRVKIGEKEINDRGPWQNIEDVDFDDQVLELARSGSVIDAVNLLVRRRGYTHTQAKQFVDELIDKV
jgi:hypothetical protein